MVPETRPRLGQLQPPDDQIRTRIGHEPSRILRQGVPGPEEGNRQHRFRIQIVSFPIRILSAM